MALYLDDKPYTKKAALDFLELSPTGFKLPTVRNKIMQLVTKRVSADAVRSPKSIGGKPEYLVFVPALQREVKIRYAITPPRAHDTLPNKMVYAHPKTLAMVPAEDGTYLIPDELEFMFWYLRPMCEQSPFRDKHHAYYYSFKDDNAKAESDMKLEENRILANAIIVGPTSWTDVKLKHLAKGMGIQGVDDMTPIIVKNELRKLAYKDPVDFYQKANSKEVIFTGKIQEAIDHEVLVLKNLNGMQRWYLGAEEILPIAYGQNPVNELKNHMAEKWYLYADKVRDALSGIDIKAKLENPQNDAAFESEPKVLTHRIKAELSAEEAELLKEIKAKDWMEEKMQKIDAYDKSDLDKMHPAQRKSYEDNKHYYEAWKKNKELESE